MLTAITGALSWLNPKRLAYLAGALVAVYLSVQVVGFVNTAVDNAALVEQQKITIQLQAGELETQEALREQAERAQLIAEAARVEAETRESELRQIRDAAIRAEDEDDGAIAPVLGETLRALRGD